MTMDVAGRTSRDRRTVAALVCFPSDEAVFFLKPNAVVTERFGEGRNVAARLLDYMKEDFVTVGRAGRLSVDTKGVNPRHEGNERASFLHAFSLSTTKSSFLNDLTLRFLTRPKCHLCDDARPIVTAEAKRAGFGVRELNVDMDERLMGKYGLRIPVLVTSDDRVIAEGVIDNARALRRMLKTAGAG